MAGFTIEVTVAAGDLDVTLPAYNTGTYNATVYWGDTTQSTITAYDDPDLTHTYATAGSYEVEITGSFPGWSAGNNDFSKITNIISWGDAVDFDGFAYMQAGWWGTTVQSLGSGPILTNGLTGLAWFVYNVSELGGVVHDGLFDNCGSVTSLYSAFYNTNVTRVVAGALDGLTSVTTFQSMFSNCSSLTTVDPQAFRLTQAGASYYRFLRDCTNLQTNEWIFSLPSETGTRFLNASPNFTDAFLGFSYTGVQGVAPCLWKYDYGTGTPTTTNCFLGGSTAKWENWKNIPTAWGGPTAVTPTITDVDSDESISVGQTAVPVTGTEFLPYQYDAVIEIADDADYESATLIVEQTITAWSDTSAEITVVQGGLSLGTNYMFVTTDRGDRNTTGFAITLQAGSVETVGSVDGIAVASISYVDGVAIANISSIDGVDV